MVVFLLGGGGDFWLGLFYRGAGDQLTGKNISENDYWNIDLMLG